MEVVEFLTSDVTVDIRSKLTSHGEVYYLNCDFSCYLTHISELFNAIAYARRLVKGRVRTRQCLCFSHNRSSFETVLHHHFNSTTLFDYLLCGDDKQLDSLKIDFMLNFPSFDMHAVVFAYHKVRRLEDELIKVRNIIVINPFVTRDDIHAFDSDVSDSDDSGL